jgi:hypothetical protein
MSLREYGKVSTSLWQSKKFRSLDGNDDAKMFYLYLHTCPHVNSIGCFRLPKGYVYEDLGWEFDRIDRAIEALCKALLIGWNQQERVVLITDFLAHSPITNMKHAAGAVKIALSLPKCSERDQIIQQLQSDRFGAKIDTLKSADRAIDTPTDTTEPEPEPETDSNRCAALAREVVEKPPEPETLEIPWSLNRSTKPVTLIAAFEAAREAADIQRRPWPTPDDTTHAENWSKAGITAAEVYGWFLDVQRRKQAAGEQPVDRLSYGASGIIEFHNRSKTDAGTHDHHGNKSQPRRSNAAGGGLVEATRQVLADIGGEV